MRVLYPEEASVEANLDVVGVGNAIVDVLAPVGESFIVEHRLDKGRMALIDADRAADLYAEMPEGLGGRASYIGKVADDDLGRVFRRDLTAAGVGFDVDHGTHLPTARCLIQVTPDAQRTLNTYLGISAHLSPADVDADLVASARILYCEGYLWDTEDAKAAIRYAMDAARRAGRIVALALSDVFCVDRHRQEWLDLLERFVDVVFGNEQEVCSLYGSPDLPRALETATSKVGLVFTTLGARGSLVAEGHQRLEVPAVPADRVVDTTGAGDLYASGVLFGLSRGVSLYDAARLGSVAAAEVIGHLGARPEGDLSGLVGDLEL